MKEQDTILSFIKIKANCLFRYFSKLFAEHVGIELSVDYLKNGGDVYFVYNNLTHKIIGGYAIIYKQPFRFIELLPRNINTAEVFFKKHSPDDFYEINGLFINDPTFKSDIFEKMITTVLALEKRYLLLFYDFNNKQIHNTWNKNLNPIELYTGEPYTENYRLESHKNIYFGYVEQESIKNFLERLKICKSRAKSNLILTN